MSSKDVVITRAIFTRKNGVRCRHCGGLIEVGERAVSKPTPVRQRRVTVYYHPGCWQQLFYDERPAYVKWAVKPIERLSDTIPKPKLGRTYSRIKKSLKDKAARAENTAKKVLKRGS
ncbi:MAG: hypothetical protein ACE5OY_08395 [Candidatus Bathyarchaeia archaeon]